MKNIFVLINIYFFLLLIIIFFYIIFIYIFLIKKIKLIKFTHLKDSILKNNTMYLDILINRINKNTKEYINYNNKNEKEIIKNLFFFKEKIESNFNKNFNNIKTSINEYLLLIEKKISTNLNENFKKTCDTFENVLKRLNKIDIAQKKIDSLHNEITSLQNVLIDKKTRGTFGEVQLNHILYSVFGKKNDKIYKIQYKILNSRVDAVIFAPKPLGTIAIDSKFPLENYYKIIDKSISIENKKKANKNFINDCKKHINNICKKYIVPNITSNQAFMFVPAEAVFAHINAFNQEIINYAQKKRVWIVSPTTLMSTLTTIQTILINIVREKYARIIQKHLQLLNIEFIRYKKRWDKLSAHINIINKDVKKIHVTTDKITKKFISISEVKKIK